MVLIKQSLPIWVKFLVILSAISFLATGVLWLVSPALLAPPIVVTNGSISHSANAVADYLAMRHFILGLALLVLFVRKEYRMLGYFLLAAGLIQALDGITDLTHKAIPSGPIVLTIVNITAAYYILRKNSSLAATKKTTK